MLIVFLFARIGSILDTHGVEFSGDWADLLSAPNSLESYSIPTMTKRIISYDSIIYTFKGCSKLKTVSFSEAINLEYIGPYAFYNTPIENLDLSMCKKLTFIGNGAFKYTTNLKTAILNEGLLHINNGLFYGSSISSICIPVNVTRIKGWTSDGTPFGVCTNLTSVTFAEGCQITVIESEAFANSGVVSIYLPKSLTSIGAAFFGCPLSIIEVDPLNTYFCSHNNALFNYDMTTIIFIAGSLTSYTIPDTVTSITASCFRSSLIRYLNLSSNLQSIRFMSISYCCIQEIIIPASVTLMDSRVFEGSNQLRSVIFLGSLSTLGSVLFNGCSMLQTFVFPSGITRINSYCFQNCISLTNLVIPSTVTVIEGGAFVNVPSSAISFEEGSTMTLNGSLLYSSDYSQAITYFNGGSGNTVYIHPSCKILCASVFELKNIQICFSPDSILESIEGKAFYSSSITSINLPNTVKYIKDNAFQNCLSLSSISLGNSLIYISSYGFYGCSLLPSISFPSTIIRISLYSFSQCTSLQSIIFQDSISPLDIQENAFRNVKITTLLLPKHVLTIGYYAFSYSTLSLLQFESSSLLTVIPPYSFALCQSLTSIVFSDSTESVASNAFYYCTSLGTLVIGSNIVNISKWSFRECSNLEYVSIPDDSILQTIFGLAFDGCNKLHTFNVNPNNPYFSTDEGVLYDKNITKIIVYLSACVRTMFSIPSTVTEIGPYAFQSCYNLKYVSIPQSVKSIGYYAFNDCYSLTNLSILFSLESIANNAFTGCNNLTCGSVKFHPTNYHLLLPSGIPYISLTECINCVCIPPTIRNMCFSTYHFSVVLNSFLLLTFLI